MPQWRPLRLAPSTVNLQTWSFACFTLASWRETFARPLPYGAPRAVMILADTHRARRVVEGFPEVQRTAATYDDKLLGLVWLLWPGETVRVTPAGAGAMLAAAFGWGLY